MFGGPIALAALGLFVTNRSRIRQERRLWLVAFGLIALVTVGASVIESTGTDQRLNQVWEQLTGGENYVIIKASEEDMKARREMLRFEISSTGPLPEVRYWIHPASTKGDAKNPDYWKFRDKGGGGIFVFRGKVGGLMGNEFPLGSYRIEMDAPNGHYVEYLNIFEFNGQLVQTIDLERNGISIYSSPRP
jgi:hypothetical protein